MDWRIFCLLVLVINASISRSLDNKLPCKFLNSVNITGGAMQPDTSIIFENVTYTKYAYITYTCENGNISHETKPYIRGCIPEDKAFIRLFCPFGSRQDCPSYQNVRNLQHPVWLGENNQTHLILDHHFGYLFDQPCPNVYEETNFTILHTGDVFIEDDEDDAIDHSQYSLEFSRNSESNEIERILKVCDLGYAEKETASAGFPGFQPSVTITNMFISAILLIITFSCYLYLPDLDHFYGKMLLCYLSGPTIAFFFIVIVKTSSISPSSFYDTIGYVVYFSFISSFAWVSVISFDLWKSFRTLNVLTTFSEQKILFLYMISAWGSAFFLTILCYIISPNKSSLAPFDSVVGSHSNHNLSTCFLDGETSANCLTYYTPIWIIFAISQLFFTLTAIKIYGLCSDNEDTSIRLKLNRQKSHINDGDNFALHFRLHLATCLTWILKALTLQYSWLGGLGFYANISYALQGLVIFVIFVMNRHVLHLIHKRWNKLIDQRETARSISVRSQTSYEALKIQVDKPIDKPMEKPKDRPRLRTVSFKSQMSYETLKTSKECPWTFDSVFENTKL